MKIYKKTIFTLLIGIFIACPVLAAEFDPSYIIADTDLIDANALNELEIQSFLEKKGGVLAYYFVADSANNITPASKVIFNASQTWQISPKFLLVMLQKEQSLVTRTTAEAKVYDWAMGYGVCDDCDKDDPALNLFKGFATQADRAAYRNRYYFDNPTKFNFQVGKTSNIDGQMVAPQTQATANLYNYTPHIAGNYNFWRIWNSWFTQGFPDGSILQIDGDDDLWLIQNQERRQFLNKEAYYTRFSGQPIIKVNKTDLEAYTIGLPIKFAQYSLVQDENKNIYLLVNEEKKKFASLDVFREIGFNPEEIIDATSAELAYYQDGRTIDANLVYPMGALVQDKGTGGIYYIEDGIKYPIMSKQVLAVNYPNRNIIKLDSKQLEKFPKGQPVKFKDGTLLKLTSNPDVYVISNGERRHIANEKTFLTLGYNWSNIIDINEQLLTIHPMGEKLDINISTTKLSTIN